MSFFKKSIVLTFIIILFGLIVRIPFLPNHGLDYDTDCWVRWSQLLQKDGLLQIYETDQKPDYPPVYLYWLQVTTVAHKAITGDEITKETPTFNVLTRIPGVAADIATGILIFLFLRNKFGKKKAFIVGLGYTLLPPIIFDTAVWGQVDSLHTFFMVVSVILMSKNKFALAWFIFGISVALKLQTVMIFIPIVVFTLRYWNGWKGFLKAGLISVAGFLFAILPFIFAGKLIHVIEVYTGYLGGTYLSANALSFWWPLHILYWDNLKYHVSGETLKLWALPIKLIGVLMLGLSGYITYRLTKVNRNSFILACAFGALTFVMFNVSMHERYMFPFFAIAALYLLNLKKKYYWIFGYFVVSYSYNLLMSLHYSLPNEIFSVWVSVPVSIVNTIVYFIFFKFLLDETKNNNSDLQREGKHIENNRAN